MRTTNWSAGRMWEICPAGLTRRYTREHEGGTADYADWSRLGAGYRRRTTSVFYHKEHKGPQGTQRSLADWLWLIGGCGALPYAPAGEGRLMPPRRTENGERRTENARQARDEEIVGVWGGAPPRKPSLQASKLPSFHLPLHSRHVCDVPKDDAAGDSGDAGARDKAIAGQRNQAFKFPTFQLYVLPAVAGP